MPLIVPCTPLVEMAPIADSFAQGLQLSDLGSCLRITYFATQVDADETLNVVTNRIVMQWSDFIGTRCVVDGFVSHFARAARGWH